MPATRSHRPVSADIGGKKGWKGLSNRAVPVNLSRLENPDLLNVEWGNRVFGKRNGYRRLHTNRLRNASTRIDGLKDYYRIPNLVSYRPGALATASFYVSIGVVLRSMPAAAVTIVSIGFGIVGNRAWQILFDPTVGAGVGGWVFRAWDLGTGSLPNVTIVDATALGEFRMLEFFVNTSSVIAANAWKEDGTKVTAVPVAITGGFVASVEDITVGVSMSAANTIGTDFASMTFSELRYKIGTQAQIDACGITTTNKWYIREIEDQNVSLFTGYWKANDGNTSGVLADSTAMANEAVPPEEAVAWTNDTAQVSGPSGLRFLGRSAWIHLKDNSAGGAALNAVFIPTAGNFGNFTLRLLHVPFLPLGAATVPDQCLLWAGHTTATPNLPQPIGLSIVGDKYVFSYNDNGTLRTISPLSASANVSLLAGKKVRIALQRLANQIEIRVGYLDGAGALVQFASLAVACTGTGSSVVSTNWSFMQHMSAFVQTGGTGGVGGVFGTPYVTPLSIAGEAVHPHGVGAGVIDHVQLIHDNTSSGIGVGLGAFTSLGPIAIYQEIINWQTWFPFSTTIFDIPMNEGSGNLLAVSSQALSNFAATLHPQLGRTVRWDQGLVDPYREPAGQVIVPYHRFRGDGTTLRETVAISGSTFYRIDEDAQRAIPIGSGIFQGGQWSTARQAGDLLFACQNGKRPLRWNGSTLDLLGIEAPLNALQVVTKAAAGTFVPLSTYTFYVTFRNKSTKDESNPSLPETVTFGAGQNTIDSLSIPISSDPQVNQRRIWMIPPPGTPGAQAYRLLEIDDNVTTQWTQDITAPVFTGEPMEYFTNQEAPQGSVIEVHKDFTFVGGNQVTPTRFFRSVAGRPSRWDHDAFFVDLDLDSGDPIVAARKQLNNLFVSLRDGWASVRPTGSTDVPIAFAFTRRDHGATGPAALTIADDLIYYLSERDIYASDGSSEVNLSSPEDDPRNMMPSIQETMTNGLNDSRRQFASMVYHRSRKQVWLACASADSESGDNDIIIIYDITQKIWSKYDIPASTLAEVDDNNDQSRVYGIVRGFVCRMDEPNWFDGVQTPIAAAPATGGSSTTFVDSTAPFTGLDLRGLVGHVYNRVTRQLMVGTIYSNTNTTVTFYDPVGGVIGAGDALAVGGYGWFGDFILDFGDPVTEKRLKWLRLIGMSDSDRHNLLVTIKATNNNLRTWNQDGGKNLIIKWPIGASKRALSIGGIGTSFRVRIQDSTLLDARHQQCPPNILGRFALSSIVFDAEELGHVI